jgi:hypothetical protein
VLVRPVGHTGKFSKTKWKADYGGERNITFSGNSGGHSCSDLLFQPKKHETNMYVLCVGERFADVNVVNRVPHGDVNVDNQVPHGQLSLYISKENNVLFTPYIFHNTQKYSLHFECLTGQENGPILALIKRTSLVIPTTSDLADLLNTFIFHKLCLSVGVCPWLSVNLKK